MVNKTPIADLPSIDEFIVEPELPSVAEFLPEEVEEEVIEEEVYNDAEGNPKIEVVDILQAPQWGELVRMVNDVREAIPEVPEIKDYAPELEEITATIQQVKEEIPIVPEVRYYESELQELRESINKVEDSIPSLPLWILSLSAFSFGTTWFCPMHSSRDSGLYPSFQLVIISPQ